MIAHTFSDDLENSYKFSLAEYQIRQGEFKTSVRSLRTYGNGFKKCADFRRSVDKPQAGWCAWWVNTYFDGLFWQEIQFIQTSYLTFDPTRNIISWHFRMTKAAACENYVNLRLPSSPPKAIINTDVCRHGRHDSALWRNIFEAERFYDKQNRSSSEKRTKKTFQSDFRSERRWIRR